MESSTRTRWLDPEEKTKCKRVIFTGKGSNTVKEEAVVVPSPSDYDGNDPAAVDRLEEAARAYELTRAHWRNFYEALSDVSGPKGEREYIYPEGEPHAKEKRHWRRANRYLLDLRCDPDRVSPEERERVRRRRERAYTEDEGINGVWVYDLI
jgi:hypothetical protein